MASGVQVAPLLIERLIADAEGEPGKLLASLAAARAEELAPLREGGAVRTEHVTAVLVQA